MNIVVSHLAEGRYIFEWSILNGLVALAGVAQFGIALHGFGCQADTGGLGAGGVRGVQVVVPLEDHQLSFGLGDLGGERLQHVTEHRLNLHPQFSTRCERRW